MMPGRYDISYYRGSTKVKTFTWKADGTAVNLTGYTVSMHIRDAEGTVLASTSDGITATVTAASGIMQFTISDAKGQGLDAGVHRYDVWAVSSGGEDNALVYGSFTVVEEVRSV